MIRITDRLSIDDNELDERFTRASGPGGQNVNKVSSAVELRFDIWASSLPDDVKERLAALGAVEDDVLHDAAAQRLGALLAEHPGHRLGEIALAAAVGADDGGDAAGELHGDRIDERLEAGDLE